MTRNTSVATRKTAPKTLELKAAAKAALQAELGWSEEPKRPIVCLPMGMTDALGGEVLVQLVPGLLTLPVELLIRGKGAGNYGELFTKLSKEYGHRIAIIPDEKGALRDMLLASDMALFLADASGTPELKRALSSGVIPVSVPGKDLKNYNPNQEEGNAFTFDKSTVWHAFAGLVRALETFRFPYDWKTIQKQAIGETDDGEE